MPRTLIIGDIHGCWDELQALLHAADLGPDDVVVSVGDLVDRGPDPGSVLDWFRARPGAVVLCGNHERKHVRGVLSYSQEVTRAQLGARYAEHVAWMAGLPYHHETPEVRVVHWGHFPGTPLDEVPEDVRAGTTSGDARLRERYGDRPWFEHYTDDVPIAFGHAVFPEALVRDGRVYGLDTGACHGGRLTGLLLPERRLVSVPASVDHWARVRKEWTAAVLRAQDWAAMPFERIEKKLRAPRDPEMARGALDGVTTWVEALRGALPRLATRLDAEVARLLAEVGPDGFGRAAAALPAASWIQRHHAGRLSRAHLGCARPADVFALADALGEDLGVARDPFAEAVG